MNTKWEQGNEHKMKHKIQHETREYPLDSSFKKNDPGDDRNDCPKKNTKTTTDSITFELAMRGGWLECWSRHGFDGRSYRAWLCFATANGDLNGRAGFTVIFEGVCKISLEVVMAR